MRRRAQAGANAWRAVEGVKADRRISKRLKGKVVGTCVTPACLYGTEIPGNEKLNCAHSIGLRLVPVDDGLVA